MLDAPRRSPEHDDALEHDERPERVVRCGACEAELARLQDRVRVGAGELHTFVNPQGEVFELICFAAAPGAAAVGEPRLEYTWFPKHAWRFALCRSCGLQLGWRFDGPAQFWGLDRKRLRLPD